MALEFRGNNNKCGPPSLPRPPYLSSAQVGSEGVGTVGSAGWVSKQDTWAPWECLGEGKSPPTRPDPPPRKKKTLEFLDNSNLTTCTTVYGVDHAAGSNKRPGIRSLSISHASVATSVRHVRRTANLSDPNSERNPFGAPLFPFPS